MYQRPLFLPFVRNKNNINTDILYVWKEWNGPWNSVSWKYCGIIHDVPKFAKLQGKYLSIGLDVILN